MRSLEIPLALPLSLFLASGLVGVWASYDPATSWAKFFLILGGIALYCFVVLLKSSPQRLVIFYWVLLSASALLVLYYVTQHDFVREPIKFGPINAIGVFLNQVSPQFHLRGPNRDSVVGALEIALPLNLMFAFQMLRERDRSKFVLASASLLLIAFGLLMTSSIRGWLTLGIVLAAGIALGVAFRFFLQRRLPNRIWILLGFFGLLVGTLSLALFLNPSSLMGSDEATRVGERVLSWSEVYAQSWNLVQDYIFTGSGLGVFPMVFSTYALLLNVPFLFHSVNLFLQIWIEQGLVGFIAFVWFALAFYVWVWKQRERLGALAIGALLAATAMLLQGLVDVRLYSNPALPLMFLPMGLTVAAVGQPQTQGIFFSGWNPKIAIGMTLAVVAGAVLMFAFFKPIAAMVYANLGSVVETRIELAPYKFPEVLVEYVRRKSDLSQAEADFYQALVFDPGNVTANQRLGAIALARGDYKAARNYLQAAYASNPTNDVTWQLLGDASLALGDLENAYRLWSHINDAPDKLQIEAAVRYDSIRDRERAALARALAKRIESERAVPK